MQLLLLCLAHQAVEYIGVAVKLGCLKKRDDLNRYWKVCQGHVDDEQSLRQCRVTAAVAGALTVKEGSVVVLPRMALLMAQEVNVAGIVATVGSFRGRGS